VHIISNKKDIEEDVNTSVESDVENFPIREEKSDLIRTIELIANLDNKDIKSNTVLNNRQVTAITLLNMAGQIYDIHFFREFVSNWCKYRISGDDGLGRKQLIAIAEAIQKEKQLDNERMLNLFSRR